MPGCCCSPFERSADQNFNQKKAAQELKRYREKGPGQTTRLLVDGVAQAGIRGGTVLDIGQVSAALRSPSWNGERQVRSPSTPRTRTSMRRVTKPHGKASETRFNSFTPTSSPSLPNSPQSAWSCWIASSAATRPVNGCSMPHWDMPSAVWRCPIRERGGTSGSE